MKKDQSSHRWFEEAVRSHLERHQGCPWCGRSHCVYHLNRDNQRVYSCQSCDFQVSYDEATDSYSHVIGEDQMAQKSNAF